MVRANDKFEPRILQTLTFGNDQVTIVKGSCVEFDQDFIIGDLWYGNLLIELQAVEAIEALDGPGLRSFGGCRHVDGLEVCMLLFCIYARGINVCLNPD
jgi:hypothetical protein